MRLRSSLCQFLWMIGAALLVATVAQAAPPRWSIQDIGAFGTTGSVPTAINNRGQVVGYSTKRIPGFMAEVMRCFLWDNGVLTDIGAPRDHCQAMGITDRGTIAAKTGYADQVYLWKDGQWTYASQGFPRGINRFEAVAGMYWTGSGNRAFLWRDGVFNDLGTLGGLFSAAMAVNDKGIVVGFSSLDANGAAIHAFAWRDGVMRDLGSLPGKEDAVPTAINSHGVIVGYASSTQDDAMAFIADANGGMRPLLPQLSGPTVAAAINDRGAVVGSWGNRSFLYDNGTLTVLEDIPEVRAAGWSRLVPAAINDRGVITGMGFHANGSPATGFVLSPR